MGIRVQKMGKAQKREGEQTMSKIKKVLAMVLTLAMVMAMGMTSFAAGETATITVNNAEDATLQKLQIIQPNQKTESGWEFTNGAGVYFTQAFNETDEQVILASLIKYADANATFTNEKLAAAPVATASQLDDALSKVTANLKYGPFGGTDGKTTEVSVAGVYAIKASGEGYTYKTMAAYVGFGVAPALIDAEPIEAKKAPTTVTKEVKDDDKIVAIGDVLTYTVKANVPYIDPNATDKTFYMYDSITGAEYLPLTEENATLTMGDTVLDLKDYRALMTENGFTIDLSSLIDAENSNASKEIVLTYKAKVTDVTVDNKAGTNVGGSDHESNPVKVYTGQITLTKYAEDGKTTLEGAGFEVYDQTSKNNVPTEGELLTFDKLGDGVYEYNPDGDITEVFTGEKGTLVVKGLDKGNYFFKETTAPEGYSINADGAYAEIIVDGEATAVIEASTSIKDTKLSSLPGTGGIGTTIFTIGGCLIMIAAAALFFASRKKAEN